MTELGDPLGQQEASGHERYAAEHRREEREQTTLNLLSAEVGQRRSEREEESRYRKRTLSLSVATLVTTFITMVAVIYYAWVAHRQLEEMKGAGVDTRNLVMAAQKSAGAALATNERLAANSRLDQRPWVGARVEVHPETGNTIRVEIALTNTGKTPAKSVRASGTTRWARTPPILSYEGLWIEDVGVLWPNAAPIHFDLPPARQVVPSGDVRLYIYGRIDFRSVFRQSLYTRYCFFLKPPEWGHVHACAEGNDTDD